MKNRVIDEQQIRLEGQRRWPSNAQMQFAWNECIEYLSQQGEWKGIRPDHSDDPFMQDLFDLIHDTGGLPLDSEMFDIIDLVHKKYPQQSPSNPPEVKLQTIDTTDLNNSLLRLAKMQQDFQSPYPKPDKTADEIWDLKWHRKHYNTFWDRDMVIEAMKEYASQSPSLRDALEECDKLVEVMLWICKVTNSPEIGIKIEKTLTKYGVFKALLTANNTQDKKEE